jgi:ketosteroid isomerase-like protein
VKRAALIPLFLLLASACSTKYIGHTRIEDTKENREILAVVERYRRAVEDRDIERLMELTADDFFEDPGTPYDPADDYDKAGLRSRLQEAFSRIKDQRLTIDARRLNVDEKNDKIVHVDYRFDHRYRLDLPGEGGNWRESMDLNRVSLTRKGGDWKIVSGL